MSEEAIDLLDKMFELDEAKRIDVKGIKQHPWYKVRQQGGAPLMPSETQAGEIIKQRSWYKVRGREQGDVETRAVAQSE